MEEGACEGEAFAGEHYRRGEECVHRPRSARAEHVQEILIGVFWGAKEGAMGDEAGRERKSQHMMSLVWLPKGLRFYLVGSENSEQGSEGLRF